MQEDDWVHVESSNIPLGIDALEQYGEDALVHSDEVSQFTHIPSTNVQARDQPSSESHHSGIAHSASEPMKDSGVFGSMNVSDDLTAFSLPHSKTFDSVLESSCDDLHVSEKHDSQLQDPSDSATFEVEEQPASKISMLVTVKDDSTSDQTCINTEVDADEPTLKTETKVEFLPDGTVVTRKITKTIRKRMVAKNVLTVSEEGDLSLDADNNNTSKVQKFLSLGVSQSPGESARPSSDKSPDTESSTSRFLAMTKEDIHEIEQTFTDGLPTDTHVERKITVVQSQTTCIEGDNAIAQCDNAGMASAPDKQ